MRISHPASIPGLVGSVPTIGIPLVLDPEGYVVLGNRASTSSTVPGSTGPTGQTGATGSPGPMGPRGPQGDDGERGAHGFVGLRGSVWSTTDVMPPTHAPSGGWLVGDQILLTTTGELYHYTGSGWTDDGVSLIGPEGPRGGQGIQGTVGPRGSMWSHTATMPPVPSLAPAGGWREGDQILHEGDAELFLYTGGVWIDEGVSIRGDQGQDGPAGVQGATGSPGPIGHDGPDGPVGPQGHDGADGHDGAGIDIKGAVATVAELPDITHGHAHHGDAYIVSATGDLYTPLSPADGGPDVWTDVGHVQGPQGIRGIPGPTGHEGIQGGKGDTGDTGTTGAVGGVGGEGPKGDPGDDGTDGAAGATGPQGGKGDQGIKGDTGDTGGVGPAGHDGTDGAVGGIGPQGIHGVKGDTGAGGTHGDTGGRGPAGSDGATGPQGEKGHSIHILSTVPTAAALPTGAADGDAHLVVATGDLMVWSEHDGASATSVR